LEWGVGFECAMVCLEGRNLEKHCLPALYQLRKPIYTTTQKDPLKGGRYA